MKESKRPIPFFLQIRPGIPIYEQLLHTVRKAMLAGALQPGDKFPSVREICREFSMNPNTVQKALPQLIQEGLLEVHPGVGSVVAKAPDILSEKELEDIRKRLELPIIEARSLGLTKERFLELCNEIWTSAEKTSAGGKHARERH